MTRIPKPPKLPALLDRKIYKTGQTRGADDDVIFQNRVSRTSTVLIPYNLWDSVAIPPREETVFENGFIALIPPSSYFGMKDPDAELTKYGLVLGGNALVFYETRSDWMRYPIKTGWRPASKRCAPLGGKYVARIAGTTAHTQGERINKGYTTTGNKGAGIRLFEYASSETIRLCRFQLEALYWYCYDSVEMAVKFGMTQDDAIKRKSSCLQMAQESGLLDEKMLTKQRLIDKSGGAVCPLCLEQLSGHGFFSRLAQAEGREVHDLTVTEVNLFHICEVRFGEYNHKPYNLGWGHHHCNVVVKDSGICETLAWMDGILSRNISANLYGPSKRCISS